MTISRRFILFHRACILGMVLIGTGILSCSTSAWGKDLPTESGEIFAMDTYMAVSATGEKAKEAVDASLEEIQRLDALWSVGNEDSVVSGLNRHESVELDEDTSRIRTQPFRNLLQRSLWESFRLLTRLSSHPVGMRDILKKTGSPITIYWIRKPGCRRTTD